jgi:hypothetical protein
MTDEVRLGIQADKHFRPKSISDFFKISQVRRHKGTDFAENRCIERRAIYAKNTLFSKVLKKPGAQKTVISILKDLGIQLAYTSS